MKLERYDLIDTLKKQRVETDFDVVSWESYLWCRGDHVAELEAKYEQLRAASFELVFAVGLTPFSGDFPANQLTRICNEVLALVDPLKKQTKSEGRINEKQQ